MTVKELVEAIDAQVLQGDIISAFDQFAADNCITHSAPDDITHSKAQKMDALRWFFSNVSNINKIERKGVATAGDAETHSEFLFDFTNHQGQPMVFHEVIRRVWENGKMVEEEYKMGQTLPKATKAPAKSKKAEPAADVKPATAPAEKKAPAAKKATVKKTQADDLTIVEGIGPKIAELLIKAGITNFAELAAAKIEALKAVLDAAGKRYQMHDPATWPKQAELARDGKTEELAKLQAKLKGGK